ncbi:MAG: cytochrome c3 family protein [Pseudohongiellaceae bacterium]|nr:cytochrome c3 family protein [Pseudohongiellaceae bacterium]
MLTNKRILWLVWLLLAVLLSGYLSKQLLVDEQKPDFLIGETTHGHYQIEMQCSVCHLEPFGGAQVLQDACVSCHKEELDIAQDSHPRSKFTDPRNADTLAKLDARLCITCHTEHNKELTHAMGVTVPNDYCFHCHEDIAQERPSHEGMAFETCSSAGCHNYHDNRAIYEDFLVDNALGRWVDMDARLPDSDIVAYMASIGLEVPEAGEGSTSVEHLSVDTQTIEHDWSGSAHSTSNITCSNCHGDAQNWVDKPALETCEDCHADEAKTFLGGKHGMRLAQQLSPMTPRQSVEAHGNLAFKTDSLDSPLGCSTCHDPHSVDVTKAAVSACLTCHDDTHSSSFRSSPHGMLWEEVERGMRDQLNAVSCATCHMPRIEVSTFGVSRILVQHNQNDTLRPNEKMLRPVCMTCHNLPFSIDALADPKLIENNFSGQPSLHIDSVDMSLERAK